MDEKERHAAGMSVRRKVLGDAHVDRSVAKTNDLTRDFQDLITRYAWGEIWTRPGLPRHTHQRLVQTAGRHVDRNDPLFFRRRRARQHHRRRACGQQQSIGPGHIVSPRIGIAAFRCPLTLSTQRGHQREPDARHFFTFLRHGVRDPP